MTPLQLPAHSRFPVAVWFCYSTGPIQSSVTFTLSPRSIVRKHHLKWWWQQTKHNCTSSLVSNIKYMQKMLRFDGMIHLFHWETGYGREEIKPWAMRLHYSMTTMFFYPALHVPRSPTLLCCCCVCVYLLRVCEELETLRGFWKVTARLTGWLTWHE